MSTDHQLYHQNTEECLQVYKKYFMPTYGPAIVPFKGKGDIVHDIDGKEYIDLACGIAVMALGHCHPEIVSALKDQADKLWHVSNAFANAPSIELSKLLCDRTFADCVFWANTGAEANEGAIKLARRYFYDQNRPEKNEIISFNKAFHGRTMSTITAGGQEKYRTGFAPLPLGFTHVDYNDFDALQKALSKDKTAAVLIEPLQGEGGVIPAGNEYIKKVRQLCDENDVLLIFDEVQTGMGRTGSLYMYESLGVTPDILTSAKALGAGIPIACILSTKKISASFVVGTHGSTFGGNPLSAAVALKALELIDRPEVYEGVKSKRQIIDQFIQNLNQELDLFDLPRGSGFLIGLPLKEKYHGKAKEILVAAREAGVMVLMAGFDVIRMTPSLIITEENLNEGLNRFAKGCRQFLKDNS